MVVYQHDPRRLPLPLHVPCPYCGVRDFLMVGNLGGRQADGTYVIAFDYRIEVSER